MTTKIPDYYAIRNTLEMESHKIYKGDKNLFERGFKGISFAPDHVFIDATVDLDERTGFIISLDPNNPYYATVQVGCDPGIAVKQVHSTHLIAYDILNDLVLERENKPEFKSGDIVYVGADYSEKIGIVQETESTKSRILINLPHKNGSSISCRIKRKHLIPTGCHLN